MCLCWLVAYPRLAGGLCQTLKHIRWTPLTLTASSSSCMDLTHRIPPSTGCIDAYPVFVKGACRQHWPIQEKLRSWNKSFCIALVHKFFNQDIAIVRDSFLWGYAMVGSCAHVLMQSCDTNCLHNRNHAAIHYLLTLHCARRLPFHHVN